MTRKNILMIISDEQCWDTLGCHGNLAAVTPNIDALFNNNGISMDRCYTAYPLCCPARTSLWTGLYPHDHYVMGNWRSIRPELKDNGLVTYFKRAGYHTIYTGKWHVPGTTPQRFQFDDVSAIPAVINGQDRGRYIESYREYLKSKGYQLKEGHIENLTESDIATLNQPGKAPCGTSEILLEDYLETWQTDRFLETLDRAPEDQPFLAVCSFNAPHFPMIVPSPFDQLISPEKVNLPLNFRQGTERKPQEVVQSRYYQQLSLLNENEWRRLIAHYWGFCALIDQQVGRITDYLKQKELFENTIIVFVSDHGDMMGSHGLIEKGFPLHYEEVLRVPLILANVGAKEPMRRKELVSLIDLLPTLADLVGVEIEQVHSGKSFALLLRNQSTKETREYVITESFKWDGSESAKGGELTNLQEFDPEVDSVNISIRTRNFKYIFRYRDIEELYDLRNDPYENRNLAYVGEKTEMLDQMRSLLFKELDYSSPLLSQIVRAKKRT